MRKTVVGRRHGRTSCIIALVGKAKQMEDLLQTQYALGFVVLSAGTTSVLVTPKQKRLSVYKLTEKGERERERESKKVTSKTYKIRRITNT